MQQEIKNQILIACNKKLSSPMSKNLKLYNQINLMADP